MGCRIVDSSIPVYPRQVDVFRRIRVTAPKRRWFRFRARCWTVLNYQLTSPEFDRKFGGRVGQQLSLRVFIAQQASVMALLLVLIWKSAPLSMIAGVVAADIILTLVDLALRRRRLRGPADIYRELLRP